MPRVVHFELVTDDPGRMKDFYERIFGWKVEKWDGPMDYWFLMTGDHDWPGIDGAFGPRESPEDTTVNTIGVSDARRVVARIEENGGEILRPVAAVPGVGWLAYFRDTEGNTWGIMQQDPDAR
jgi:predicted enzyme related to lactoylglutathione lyase